MSRLLDAPDPGNEEEDLRSRTDLRKERLAMEEGLMKLAEALVSSGDGVLGKMVLSEGLMDAIRNAQRVRAGAARNRALRLVRATLRDEDFEGIRKALGTVHGRGGIRR